jgi:DNA-binding protein HU-beta
MNRGHLISKVAQKTKVSKVAADQILDVVFAEMADALKRGEKVVIKDLMTLSVSNRQTRNGRNPQTGEPIKIEGKKAIRAKAGKKLETMLNRKRFESEVLSEKIDHDDKKKAN